MNGKFALLLSLHRVLGPIFNPVVITKNAGQDFWVISDRISMANLHQYDGQLFPEQKKLVNVIEEYSDTHLLKIFTKRKISIQDFFSSVDENLFNMQIRPYIERRLNRCIELLSGSDTLIFLKKQHHNIYDSDRVYLQDDIATAVFNFIRKPEGLTYSLTINYNDEDINLTNKSGFVLINDPCVLLFENRLLLFDDIDGKKLLPFFKNQSVFVRKETEKKFLETFAKQIIQKYQVHAEGFRIVDQHPEPTAVLSLENNLKNKPGFILRFRYDDNILYDANRKSELQVRISEHDHAIEFRRLNRNVAFENRIISSLLKMGLANMDLSCFTPLNLSRIDNVILVYDLVSWLNFNSKALADLGIEVVQRFSVNRYYLKQVNLKLKVRETEHDWFDINATVKLDDIELPFIKFRQHLLDGRREYGLPDGRILVLPEAWFARFKDFMSFAREENNQLILEKQHFPLLDKTLKGFESSYSDKVRQLLDADHFEEQPVPAEIRCTLRDYQKTGYSWLWKLNRLQFGGCLADDMGLGKTIQTLTLLQRSITEEKTRYNGPVNSVFERQLTIFDQEQRAQGKAVPSLVVVPSTLIHNWINEIMKFAPSILAGYYGGQNRKPFGHYYNAYDLIITSYGYIRNDFEIIKSYDFLYIILDESQVIKNRHSKTYKAITAINSIHRLILTGTPVENSLTDLWSQMNFLNPGLLGNFRFFKGEFVMPIEKNHNKHQTRILQTLISPFVMRRTKSEVARELPGLSRQQIYCDMTEAQYGFYETEKSKVRNLVLDNILKTGMRQSSFIILQSLTRLRQAANHPVLIEPDYAEDSGKYNAIRDNIHNLLAEKHKVLVFSSFVKHLELFTAYCRQSNIPYSCLTGDVPQKKREQIIHEFQESGDIFLFFISIKAGGYGLNLTSADYVFILDPWWNPAVEEQAISRSHRMGQKNKVFVYRFIAKDTIEEKILMLQDRKSSLAQKFTDSNNPLASADKEEILGLFD
ncbi:MAG: DEAD/DEAH box helicase [Bacteroidales bacterium]|nr:DEAD/DEAH box helicase [Bacteroidales bacterium]